jgi:hypothetical protein
MYQNFYDMCKVTHVFNIHRAFPFQHLDLKLNPFIEFLDQMHAHDFSQST